MFIPVHWLPFILFLLSGATGLVYEVVWTRQLVFLLGGTTYAITTVLVAFMSGLALGSWLSGRFGLRLGRPGQAYGALEIIVGLYALAVPVLLRMAEPLYRALYPHVADSPGILTAVRFCVGAMVILLPATCMGATLPMLVRYLAGGQKGLGRSTGLLYGINTCGAVAGTLLAGFVLIPRLGLKSTTWATAAVNVAIGTVALLLLRGERIKAAEPTPPPPPRRPSGKTRQPVKQPTSPDGLVITRDVRQTVLAVAGLSGFAAMVYQIAWTRALVMSLGSSTYAFTCILAAFILGLGLGSLVVARWVDRWSRPILLLALMELGIALAAIFIIPIHGRLPLVVHDLVVHLHQQYGRLLIMEFALVIAVTFVPTFLMGAIFPLVVRLVGTSDTEAGSAVGRAYAINTLGTIFGSFLAGFVLIRGDVLGIQYSIVAAAVLNAIAAAWLLTKSGPEGRMIASHAAVGGLGFIAVLTLGVTTGQWQKEVLTSAPFLHRGAGLKRETLFFFEDVDTTVSVDMVGTEKTGRSLTLSVNGKADASTGPADLRTQLLVGHLPALLDRNGRTACIIGLGSGMTLGSVAQYPSYEQIDCIELSEGVIAASEYFKDHTYDVLNTDPRVRLMRADGRNHLLLTSQRYDLIVSEPSNPWLAGVSNLFTRDFFDLCRQRLTPDGVFAGWLQSYSISETSFKMVIRTLLDVFDSVTVWEAGLNDYCLIAWNGSPQLSLEDIAARFDSPGVQQDLYRVSLFDLGSILGNYVTGGPPLRRWVADAPIHTDDNALLEFRAPWDLYTRSHVEISRALLAIQHSPLDHVIHTAATPKAVGSSDPAWLERIQSRIESTLHARRMRVAGSWQWEHESELEGIETLIAGYNVDPGNFLIYQLLMFHSGELETIAQTRPSAATWVKKIDSLPPPPMVPSGGVPREQMAGMIKALTSEAIRNAHWSIAAAYLAEADRLTPGDPEIAEMLATVAAEAPEKVPPATRPAT